MIDPSLFRPVLVGVVKQRTEVQRGVLRERQGGVAFNTKSGPVNGIELVKIRDTTDEPELLNTTENWRENPHSVTHLFRVRLGWEQHIPGRTGRLYVWGMWKDHGRAGYVRYGDSTDCFSYGRVIIKTSGRPDWYRIRLHCDGWAVPEVLDCIMAADLKSRCRSRTSVTGRPSNPTHGRSPRRSASCAISAAVFAASALRIAPIA
jgi:hypothetical protein